MLTQKLSTNELAAILRVNATGIRGAMCRTGHFLGMRPVKLKNGRLLWDSSEVACLLEVHP